MKKYKYIRSLLVVLIASAVVIACSDDDGSDVIGDLEAAVAGISGSGSVEIATTSTYSVLQRRDATYSWAITGASTISASTLANGDETTSVVTVTFPAAAGTATLSVTETLANGSSATASTEITIVNTPPTGTARLAGAGVYAEGKTDSVIVEYDFPVSAPSITSTGLGTDLDEVAMTAVGSSGTVFAHVVTFTSDSSSADIDFSIAGAARTVGGAAQPTAATASGTMDWVTPFVDFSVSASEVKDSTEVDIMVSFSEDVVTADSTLAVTITGVLSDFTIDTLLYLTAAGWDTTTVTLPEMEEEVITVELQLEDDEGTSTVDEETDITDIAGNRIELDPSAEGGIGITVDNTAPEITGTDSDVFDTYQTISAGADDSGTITYIILEAGSEVPWIAPDDATADEIEAADEWDAETLADFTGIDGVLYTGSFSTSVGSAQLQLPFGDYDAYFIAVDTPGNLGDPTDSEENFTYEFEPEEE